MSIYNVEVTENKTNYEFGKKATLNQIELNKKSKIRLFWINDSTLNVYIISYKN